MASRLREGGKRVSGFTGTVWVACRCLPRRRIIGLVKGEMEIRGLACVNSSGGEGDFGWFGERKIEGDDLDTKGCRVATGG